MKSPIGVTMSNRLERRLGEYIIAKIHEARPDLDIELHSCDEDYKVRWTGILTFRWGPDYETEENHLVLMRYYKNAAGDLGIAGGGDGVFHYAAKATVDIPNGSTETQIGVITSSSEFRHVLDEAIAFSKRLPTLEEIEIHGFRRSLPARLI